MAIFHNGKEIQNLYHNGKQVESVYHNGIKIYSSLLPVGTSVFNDTYFVIDNDNASGSVGNRYYNERMSGNVYKVITLKYPLSECKNGVEINFSRIIALYHAGSSDVGWVDNTGVNDGAGVNDGDLSIKIPKSSSKVSYYFNTSGSGESNQGNITISINGRQLTMTHLSPNNGIANFYPIISSITAY